MGCPLCNELTHKASARLIRDTCGHFKCRLCLLKEENGCRICEEEHKIDSIGSFNYPLPSSKSPNYEFPNCEPLQLSINTIPVNLEISEFSQPVDTEITNYTVNEINLQSLNYEDPTETNENIQQNEISSTAENQNMDNQNVPTFQVIQSVQKENSNGSNNFHHLNDDRTLVIDERTENTEDAQSNNLGNQKNLQNNNEANENQIVYQSVSPDSLCLPENSSQAINSKVVSPSNSHPNIAELQNSLVSIENPSKLEETEKPNLHVSDNTPKHLSCTSDDSRLLNITGSPLKSPAFRLSDYLTFNKQNEMGEASPLSVNYRSPVFRLSDYIVFKDRASQDKVTQRIDKDLNEGERKSGDYISSDGFLVQRVPAGDQSLVIETEDDLQNNYCDETDTAADTSYLVSDSPSHPLKKKLSSNSTVDCSPKQSKNVICDPEGTNSSLLKQTKSKNGKTEDDEDKENKKCKRKKNSTKIRSGAKTTALKKVNLPSKSKSKNVDNLKTKSNKPKKKKKEETVKLGDEPITIRRGERKRKRKMLVYENEVLEVVTKKRCYRNASSESSGSTKPKPGRRRRNRNMDWSHVIRLPDSPARYRCTVCKACFGHWRGRSSHAACRLGVPPYSCNVCDRNFYKRTHFEYHERTHTGVKPFTCRLCSKGFFQKNKLNRHLDVHKQQKDIQCDICKKIFNSKEYLKNHLLSHQENVFECPKCPKTFSLKHNLKRHEVSHTTARPYACNMCSSTFKCKYLLSRHKRLHDISRPYSCEHCDRVFLSKFEVARHMPSHSGLKQFKCETCNSKFRRKDNLRRHELYHSQVAEEDDELSEGSTDDENESLHTSELPTPDIPTDKSDAKELGDEASIPDKGKNMKKTKTAVNKSSSKSSKNNTSNKGVPVSIISTKSKFAFVDDIPREKALLLNQQIENKMQAQKKLCRVPGLTAQIDLCLRERDKQKQKTRISDNSSDELRQRDGAYVHWRRRTAETLKFSTSK